MTGKTFKTVFSKGDRIKFCRNGYRDLKVSNGTLGTLTSIKQIAEGDYELTVKIDDGRVITFSSSNYADSKGTYLSHAYALTIYSSQGCTVDGSTFVYGGESVDQKEAYVALSRHKDMSFIYIDSPYKSLEKFIDYEPTEQLSVLASEIEF